MSHCHECGASLREYKKTFNRLLASCLERLWVVGGHATLKELRLSTSQYNAFQQLKYWGLIRKYEAESRTWRITEKGDAFIKGNITIPKSVITYRNTTVGTSGPLIFYCDALGDTYIRNREDYLYDI